MKHLQSRKIVVVLALGGLFYISPAYSQQDPLYGLYINNPFTINPAYSGINDNLTAFVAYRKQWTGYDGSPSTASAGGHISLRKNRIGAGLLVVNDRVGENTNTQFTGTFAYKLKLSEGTTLSFGMSGGFVNYKSDPSQLKVRDPNDPYFTSVTQMQPIIGAGVLIKGDRFLFGISVPRLLNNSFDLGGQKINLYQQQFYGLASYLFPLSERIVLKPSVLIKATKGAPFSTDLNISFIIDRNYTAGIFTRNLNTYGGLLQYVFSEKYRIAYAVEVPTSKSVGTKFVTHEIMIGLRMPTLKSHSVEQTNF